MSADKVIFPGVGEAGSAMNYLASHNLDKLIPQLTQPVLGICLGMQLMCRHSEEGDTQCLGIIDEQVKRFSDDKSLKVPHMGWNTVSKLSSPLFSGLNENEYLYFVHSYYVECGNHTSATTSYGVEFASAIQKDNFYGVQFHSEKSAKAGEKIIENFLSIK
jgi:glutamine amidotransferase